MAAYKHINDEQVKNVKTWAKNAKEESEQLNVVLNGIKRQLSKERESNTIAKAIDSHWVQFRSIFSRKMPHVVYNNTKTIVHCDWVEAKANTKLDSAFRQYRYFGEEITTPQNAHGERICVGYIERTVEKERTITFTHPSGYEEVRPLRDAEGKVVTDSVVVKLVPREKKIWGYTETVINAFIAAADELLDEIEREENV